MINTKLLQRPIIENRRSRDKLYERGTKEKKKYEKRKRIVSSVQYRIIDYLFIVPHIEYKSTLAYTQINATKNSSTDFVALQLLEGAGVGPPWELLPFEEPRFGQSVPS